MILKTINFPSQHILMSLLSIRNSNGVNSHLQLLALLNGIQCACLRGPLLNTEVLLLNLIEYFNAEVILG